jgi:hypothetical protein
MHEEATQRGTASVAPLLGGALDNALRHVKAQAWAVYGVAFLANSKLLDCEMRLVAHPNLHFAHSQRIVKSTPGETT